MPMLEIVITGLCALLFHGPANLPSYDTVELLVVDTTDEGLQTPQRPEHRPQLSFRVLDYVGPDKQDFPVEISPRGEEIGSLGLAGSVVIRPLASQSDGKFTTGWIGHPFGPKPAGAMDWVPDLRSFGIQKANSELNQGSGIVAKIALPAGALSAHRIVLSPNSDEPMAITYSDGSSCPQDGDTHFVANSVVLRVPLHPEETEVEVEINGVTHLFDAGREPTLRLAITNLPASADLPLGVAGEGTLIEHLRWFGVLATNRDQMGQKLEHVKVPCVPPAQTATSGFCPTGRFHLDPSP